MAPCEPVGELADSLRVIVLASFGCAFAGDTGVRASFGESVSTLKLQNPCREVGLSESSKVCIII